jgi:hypothetical protein
MKLHIGDAVTVLVREEAYYSGYAGNPRCFLEPGQVAYVGAVKVPYVRESKDKGRGDYFTCVDWVADGRKWRAGVANRNIRKVR